MHYKVILALPETLTAAQLTHQIDTTLEPFDECADDPQIDWHALTEGPASSDPTGWRRQVAEHLSYGDEAQVSLSQHPDLSAGELGTIERARWIALIKGLADSGELDLGYDPIKDAVVEPFRVHPGMYDYYILGGRWANDLPIRSDVPDDAGLVLCGEDGRAIEWDASAGQARATHERQLAEAREQHPAEDLSYAFAGATALRASQLDLDHPAAQGAGVVLEGRWRSRRDFDGGYGAWTTDQLDQLRSRIEESEQRFHDWTRKQLRELADTKPDTWLVCVDCHS